MMSDSTMLMLPYLILSAYCAVKIFIAAPRSRLQKRTNPTWIVQYNPSHFLMPNGEALDLLGRTMFSAMSPRMRMMLISHFCH
jgi:hypothetical protein